MRALRIAVARAVGSARLVVATLAAILRHLHKVHRSIEAAWQRRGVNVEAELPILQPKDLVVLADGQVQTRTYVRPRHELELNAARRGNHAVGILVLLRVHTGNSALLCARLGIRADGFVPLASVEAVPRAVARLAAARAHHLVHPAPVCVQRDVRLLDLATGGLGAERKREGRGLLDVVSRRTSLLCCCEAAQYAKGRHGQ
mmetsp:Transcript_107217/g.320679  ORF Transcript_107217/g.320679 Transcript_107217/m.320679 type:complete len:202 (+) Transcript_107217:1114-1719(+)